MNRRRAAVAIAIATFVVACPTFSRAKMRRIGFLSARRRPDSLDADYYGAFPRRLRELGYIEGENIAIEWRYAGGDYDRIAGMADELVRMNVDVLLALGPPVALAAQKATATIPIVFVVSADPVKIGLVKSLSRPGGSITGISNLGGELTRKHLELLRDAMPKLSRVALLVNPANAAHPEMARELQRHAQNVGVAIVAVDARSAGDLEGAYAGMKRERAAALIVPLDPLFIQLQPEIAQLAIRERIPSIFATWDAASAGGLMSYGQNQVEIHRRLADYVDRILKGAKAGDLPVEQPTKIELAINLKTARALGLVLPQTLLNTADRVIE
ncbi:MAG TPA: ABC transporter substrate-binding protein [Casimicrobiaceae bacterium]|nr:ABC transporter substrate-binding protein [Casimicrobiaceae bacterium]